MINKKSVYPAKRSYSPIFFGIFISLAPIAIAGQMPKNPHLKTQPSTSSTLRDNHSTEVKAIRSKNDNLRYLEQSIISANTPQVVIEVSYTYEPTDDEFEMNGVNRDGGNIGKRTVIPLESYNPISFIDGTVAMRKSFENTSNSSLILQRSFNDSSQHILVFIGSEQLSTSTLQISQGHSINFAKGVCGLTEDTDIKRILVQDDIKKANVVLWLEAGNLRYPFQISHLSKEPTFETALDCYAQSNKVLPLNLIPSTIEPGKFRAQILLEGNIMRSPGGIPNIDTCEDWAKKKGYWYLFLQALAKCTLPSSDP